jgi:hypothetical protein|tara:strand:- start:2173 stop:3657 length:1485 start_codon:yes stop_codon:yes gene_type:complete
MNLNDFRHFFPNEDCSLNIISNVVWDLDSTEIDSDEYPVFSKFINTYEELYETKKKAICFIDPPPYVFGEDKTPQWDFSNCEKLKKVVNDDKLILLLSRIDEQFLANEMFEAIKQFKENNFNIKNIRLIDGNLNFDMVDFLGFDKNNFISFDIARFRFPLYYKYAYKDILPYSDEFIDKMKTNKKDYKFLTMNGTLHHYRALLVCWLLYNKYHKEGLISACVHIDSLDSNFEYSVDAGNYVNKNEIIEHWENILAIDGYIRDFILNDFENHLPLLLDHVGDDFSDNTNGLVPFTMSDNLPKKYKSFESTKDKDFIKVVKEQIIASQQCETYLSNIVEHYGNLPYKPVVESIAGFINYENSYFSIVGESPPITYKDMYFLGDKEYWINFMKITEKTYRSLCFHPIILLSAPFLLRNLKKDGFETFPELFDESYDEILDENLRFKKVFSELDRVLKMSTSKLHEIYVDILPKIVHNQKKLYSMSQLKYLEKIYSLI